MGEKYLVSAVEKVILSVSMGKSNSQLWGRDNVVLTARIVKPIIGIEENDNHCGQSRM